MLTPLDLHQKEFNKSLRGYKPEEVDEFLRQVATAYEALYQENLVAKDQILRYEENLSRYQKLEETLNNTLVLAQKTAEEVRLATEREGVLLLKEAHLQAEQILAAAREQKQQVEKAYETIRSQARQFRVQFRAMLLSQLAAVKEDEAWEETAATVMPAEPQPVPVTFAGGEPTGRQKDGMDDVVDSRNPGRD
ncbi:MAG: DivIVA domain-containing protein [Heliobacteriaceae bacterium]|nr:DivIVA domain-containing protein [Heliobacteriaceae bacterium]MDD4587470.1 DivIVA domain-containing protein [Heliobacteriaceae bacterium]